MKKKFKFNQDQFGWTLKSLREDLDRSNNLKSQKLDQNKEIEEKKLAVKDRVDLSLKEYKEMLEKIVVLESSNSFYEDIFRKLHIQDYIGIMDYASIGAEVRKDELTRKQRVHICFEIKML